VALEISSATQPFITELAFIENVSLHGVRAIAARCVDSGERVLLKSTMEHSIVAKVIYCHELARRDTRLVLELHFSVGTWGHLERRSSRLPRSNLVGARDESRPSRLNGLLSRFTAIS